MLPLGSELWQLFYDRDGDCYVPKNAGTVGRVAGSRAFAGGRWHELGYPYFTSKAEADAFVTEHPFSAPTIK
jgi:hypothetical protein